MERKKDIEDKHSNIELVTRRSEKRLHDRFDALIIPQKQMMMRKLLAQKQMEEFSKVYNKVSNKVDRLEELLKKKVSK